MSLGGVQEDFRVEVVIKPDLEGWMSGGVDSIERHRNSILGGGAEGQTTSVSLALLFHGILFLFGTCN